jgi:transketolase
MNQDKKILVSKIADKARAVRRHAINMTLGAGSEAGHVGPGLSIVDIVTTLYFGVMRVDPSKPQWPDRDRLVLSKGHGVLGYYPVLAEAGFFSMDVLYTFEKRNSLLAGHPSAKGIPGIDCSTGSLGHGLSIGVGMALAAKIDKRTYDTYVLIGDGEQNEGTIWEAAMAACHYGTDNLVVIVDKNGLQIDSSCKEVMDMEPIRGKWKSFGWEVKEVDGHDIEQLLDALDKKQRPRGKPYVVIAKTIKGKGVSFIENNNLWHHRAITPEEATAALAEIDAGAQLRGGN